MQLTITIDEAKLARLCQDRISELVGDDCRYRDSPARVELRSAVDAAAREAFAGVDMAAIIRAAVESRLVPALEAAAGRAVDVRVKRMVALGFKPDNLTPEAKAWLTDQIEKQMAGQATKAEVQ